MGSKEAEIPAQGAVLTSGTGGPDGRWVVYPGDNGRPTLVYNGFPAGWDSPAAQEKQREKLRGLVTQINRSA